MQSYGLRRPVELKYLPLCTNDWHEMRCISKCVCYIIYEVLHHSLHLSQCPSTRVLEPDIGEDDIRGQDIPIPNIRAPVLSQARATHAVRYLQ